MLMTLHISHLQTTKSSCLHLIEPVFAHVSVSCFWCQCVTKKRMNMIFSVDHDTVRNSEHLHFPISCSTGSIGAVWWQVSRYYLRLSAQQVKQSDDEQILARGTLSMFCLLTCQCLHFCFIFLYLLNRQFSSFRHAHVHQILLSVLVSLWLMLSDLIPKISFSSLCVDVIQHCQS